MQNAFMHAVEVVGSPLKRSGTDGNKFRVYIALLNTWLRKRSSIIEKREVPEQIIEMTAGKYEGYQGQEFQKLFRKVWKEDMLHEVMIKQGSV